MFKIKNFLKVVFVFILIVLSVGCDDSNRDSNRNGSSSTTEVNSSVEVNSTVDSEESSFVRFPRNLHRDIDFKWAGISDDKKAYLMQDDTFSIVDINNSSEPSFLHFGVMSRGEMDEYPQEVRNYLGDEIYENWLLWKDHATKSDTNYYQVGRDGLKIYEFTESNRTRLLSTLDLGGRASRVVISENKELAYVIVHPVEDPDSNNYNQFDSLKIIDIGSSDNPSILSSIETGLEYRDIVLSSLTQKAYLVDSDSLKIIDISNSSNLTVSHTLGGFGGGCSSIALSEDEELAYISAQTNGLIIIDLSSIE